MPKKNKTYRSSRSKESKLPTEKKEPITDVLKYTLLLYGREKIGKTTFFSSFPDALFLTTEPGTKGLRIFEYNSDGNPPGCQSYQDLLDAVSDLERSDRFKTVIIDTVVHAFQFFIEKVEQDLDIPAIGQTKRGKRDYGYSYSVLRKEFSSFINRIIRTGRGLYFTAHSTDVEIEGHPPKIFPRMSKTCRTVVEALVDFFFYVDYVVDSKGFEKRIIITQGSSQLWAGSRAIDNVILPRFLPLTLKGGYEILKSAFEGDKNIGLDPRTLETSKTPSEVLKKFIVNSVPHVKHEHTKTVSRFVKTVEDFVENAAMDKLKKIMPETLPLAKPKAKSQAKPKPKPKERRNNQS